MFIKLNHDNKTTKSFVTIAHLKKGKMFTQSEGQLLKLNHHELSFLDRFRGFVLIVRKSPNQGLSHDALCHLLNSYDKNQLILGLTFLKSGSIIKDRLEGAVK